MKAIQFSYPSNKLSKSDMCHSEKVPILKLCHNLCGRADKESHRNYVFCPMERNLRWFLSHLLVTTPVPCAQKLRIGEYPQSLPDCLLPTVDFSEILHWSSTQFQVPSVLLAHQCWLLLYRVSGCLRMLNIICVYPLYCRLIPKPLVFKCFVRGDSSGSDFLGGISLL